MFIIIWIICGLIPAILWFMTNDCFDINKTETLFMGIVIFCGGIVSMITFIVMYRHSIWRFITRQNIT